MKMILRWAQRFVVAYGIIMLATFFMCLFFCQEITFERRHLVFTEQW